MDQQAILTIATSQVARLITKLGSMAGISATVLSQDKTAQLAAAIVALASFGIEIIQSHYAQKIAATNAVAAATGTAPKKV